METFQSTLTKDYFVAGKAKYFPVAVFVIASITLMTIQVLCHAIPHHVPDWLFFAPFSVAAVGEPERYIYGIGMTLAALFFLGTLYYVYKAYAERLDHRFMCPWKVRTRDFPCIFAFCDVAQMSPHYRSRFTPVSACPILVHRASDLCRARGPGGPGLGPPSG
jgi:hypothetical protein